jgi:hypothetical protein
LKLDDVVPWGRNFSEYKEMFLLSNEDLKLDILSCADGPSSFNFEATKQNINVTSIDPIYQFSKFEIKEQVNKTSKSIIKELKLNKNSFAWKSIKSVEELIDIRLSAMNNFLEDYDDGKAENRYIFQELPTLLFEDNRYDLLLSSHFLFLYSDHLDAKFHIDSVLQMCRVAKKEVRIFPILNLQNKVSDHLIPVMDKLKKNGYKSEIVKTKYEFQKGANEMLIIEV